jgi:hypothetical protein
MSYHSIEKARLAANGGAGLVRPLSSTAGAGEVCVIRAGCLCRGCPGAEEYRVVHRYRPLSNGGKSRRLWSLTVADQHHPTALRTLPGTDIGRWWRLGRAHRRAVLHRRLVHGGDLWTCRRFVARARRGVGGCCNGGPLDTAGGQRRALFDRLSAEARSPQQQMGWQLPWWPDVAEDARPAICAAVMPHLDTTWDPDRELVEAPDGFLGSPATPYWVVMFSARVERAS